MSKTHGKARNAKGTPAVTKPSTRRIHLNIDTEILGRGEKLVEMTKTRSMSYLVETLLAAECQRKGLLPAGTN